MKHSSSHKIRDKGKDKGDVRPTAEGRYKRKAEEAEEQIEALKGEYAAKGIELSGRIIHVTHYLPLTVHLLPSKNGVLSPPLTPPVKASDVVLSPTEEEKDRKLVASQLERVGTDSPPPPFPSPPIYNRTQLRNGHGDAVDASLLSPPSRERPSASARDIRAARASTRRVSDLIFASAALRVCICVHGAAGVAV